MKALKIALIVIGSIVVVFLIIFGIYLLLNIQGEAESFEVGSPELEQKVLIASQGSDFKNALVKSLTEGLKEKSIYIKVVDVSALSEVNEDEWDALVFIHTTEKSRLQPNVKEYVDRAKDLSKVMLITTSGTGKWKTEDYDIEIITSASKMDKLNALCKQILAWLYPILQTETM